MTFLVEFQIGIFGALTQMVSFLLLPYKGLGWYLGFSGGVKDGCEEGYLHIYVINGVRRSRFDFFFRELNVEILVARSTFFSLF